MEVLTINCGSSTLKFDLMLAGGEISDLSGVRRLGGGLVDQIGGKSSISFTPQGGQTSSREAPVSGHGDAARQSLEWLGELGYLQNGGLDGVGHRVVHGGSRFTTPTRIDQQVIQSIEDLTQLAPLHNGPSLEAIKAAREALDQSIPMVAVFDTTFHQTMPDRAYRYAIPEELAEKHHIRRYGFHGLAHQYMAERYAAITGVPLERLKLITLQLGNGCSAAAISGGRSVDTSMGFTPLEGLMMGTRSGDVDPSLAGYLARREGVGVNEVEDWLNTRSGLLGVSGRSRDMRDLLEAEEQGDRRAALAVEMFCYRVRKYIGAYLAVLSGADAVIFGGGIGENSPAVRARICGGLDWCGLSLDQERNAAAVKEISAISLTDAKVLAYVIPVDEAAIIARETARCLADTGA